MVLIQVLSWFSSPGIKQFFKKGITSMAYQFSRRKRRISEKNISTVFGQDLSEVRKKEIVKGNFYEFWNEVFSLFVSSAEKQSLKGAEIRGLDHLHTALKKGNGVILWESNSFGGRSLAKRILHENGFSLYQVHARSHIGGFANVMAPETWVRHHIIRPFFEKLEKEFIEEIIYLPNSSSLAFTRQLWGMLAQNKIICITGDGRLGQKLIPLQFLGHTQLFSTGMVSLARLSGAPILPIFCIQNRSGNTCLVIEPPINIEGNEDRDQGLKNSVAEYAGLLESYIRKYPEKYRSWHHLESGGKN
ncbi:MAG TPA: lysophospholipid acyltransferase family protein [Thermodesulfobacteriota bacterium]|nr:lysophospholipid acyltransferase family protein [Thermodesulfobacteriota bacterium]